MKVNDSININMNKMNIYISNKLIKEGSLIEGEILDVIEDLVIIDADGIGIIKAYTQEDLSEDIGKTLDFIVKTSLPNKIELKPIFENIEEKGTVEFTNEKENYLTNVLKEFHIEDNPISLEFLDSLIKYNVQINRENLIDGIRIFEKLEQLLNLNEDAIISVASPKEENFNIDKVDIRNLIIMDKADNHDKTYLGKVVKEDLIGFLDKGLDSETVKTISFFIKYDIKPTINNIKSFQILRENPELFSEDYKILEETIDKKFTNSDKRIIISNGSPKNLVEKSIVKYKMNLDRIINYIKENGPVTDKDTKKSIDELRNKIEFLEEMNKELVFVYLPLEYDNQDGAITLLKKRKRKNDANGKINIFVDLWTNKLGNINICCEALNRSINIKFSQIKDEDLNLFKSNEDKLKTLVEYTGYEIGSIEYSLDKGNDILSSLITNTKPIYYLDVKV